MENKNRITLERLLYLFIIICPILDAGSFLFRNYFNTNISISTILRPVIPIIVIIYIFLKDKIKLPLVIAGVTYILYAGVHLYIFHFLKTESSYGNLIRELQYLVNYSFMIMNLFLYIYVFIFRKKNNVIENKNEKMEKLRVSMLIAFTIYIVLMFLSIITGTSSHTYMEDEMGYKGWFESGNSVGAIMIIMLFALLPTIIEKECNKKIKIWIIIDTIFAGIYLSTLLGTRVGLFGFIATVIIFLVCYIVNKVYNNKKISKKVLCIITGTFISFTVIVILCGSITLSRRKLLKDREDDIYDETIGEASHVTGDILEFVRKINNNEISEEYMSLEVQNTIIDLYKFCNERKISYTNMRSIQMVYHVALLKNQRSFSLLLFGNGYMTHYYEMIFEMEVPAFLINFGIYGFILYFIPFLIIAVLGICFVIKNIKKITVKTIMTVTGLWFAIASSFFSGYTFFNQSVATIITVLCVIILNEIIKMKGEKIEKDNIWNNKLNFRGSRESSSRFSK